MQVVSDIPVKVTTVLGKTNVLVRRLMNMKPGNVVELDRKVGDSVDLFVNGQLIARGELVLVGTQMAVTMTEILKSEYSKP
jgi:flagellar motor switch protein FliN/FliY